MEVTPEILDRMDRYAAGDMSTAEKELFETEIQSDPAFRLEWEMYQQSVLAVRMNAFRNTLNNLHEETPVRSIRPRRWLYVAAGVAVVIASTLYVILHQNGTEALFAQYVTTDPGLPVPMSATSNFLFYDAMVDYKNEQYEKAIQKWNGLLVDHPQNDTLIYYVGISHFNAKSYTLASQQFDRIEALSNSSWKYKAEWYLVLSLLQTKDFERIHSIAQNCDGPYCDKIRNISAEIQ